MPKNKPRAFALTSAYIQMLHDEVVSLPWPAVATTKELLKAAVRYYVLTSVFSLIKKGIDSLGDGI